MLVTLFMQAIGWRIDPFNTMVALFALVMLPSLAAGLVDQYYGARLQPDGAAYHAIAAVLGFYTRTGMVSRRGASNVHTRKPSSASRARWPGSPACRHCMR